MSLQVSSTALHENRLRESALRGFWRNEARIKVVTALLGIVLSAVAGFLALQQAGGGIVTLSYDLPFLVHRAGGAGEIRMVLLEELAGEGLDRSVQAPLLDRLREAGARAVVYDVLFDREWPDRNVDEAFAGAIRRFRGVDEEGNPIEGVKQGVVLLACGRETLGQTGVQGERLIPPTDLLFEASGYEFGLVALAHDDFVVREFVAGTRDDPSITWKAAVALGADLEEGERLAPRWINFAGPPPHPEQSGAASAIVSIPAQAVLDDANPELFRDKIVLIGGKPGIVSPNLGEDLFSTPFHRLDFRGALPYMGGVEVQANILANLLQGNWLHRSSRSFDVAFVILISFLTGVAFSRVRPFTGIFVAISGIILLAVAGTLAIHFGQVWFPWSVAALVQIPVGLLGGTASHFYTERYLRVKLSEEQERLRDAFERYVSPQMLSRILDEDFHLQLGGEKVEAAMLFTDIENFTGMCQNVGAPEVIVENLNGYFERTTGEIFDHDGVVIKFIGDAIFAAWGVPFADERAPIQAVRAAWKVFENARFVIAGDELRTRVGLHFGEVVAGNIGSSRHIDYTLIGDSVNLAARLEGLNKMLGTSILMSGELVPHLEGEFWTRRVGRFRVKGRRGETEVHELLGPVTHTTRPDWVDTYEDAVEALEKGDREVACQLFEETDRARLSGDGPSRFFLERIENGESLEEGVAELKEK